MNLFVTFDTDSDCTDLFFFFSIILSGNSKAYFGALAVNISQCVDS